MGKKSYILYSKYSRLVPKGRSRGLCEFVVIVHHFVTCPLEVVERIPRLKLRQDLFLVCCLVISIRSQYSNRFCFSASFLRPTKKYTKNHQKEIKNIGETQGEDAGTAVDSKHSRLVPKGRS
jgi:hypothetical protein